MKHIEPMPDESSSEDRRIYRRQTGGLFISYFIAIIFAFGITYLNKPEADPTASQSTQVARLKPAS